ncbi:hypothetical protein [Marinifilum flexuosum]|uniref:hypothetical protein n=1 Tax=Marinifilum flexuosum TaxID=1117708 RepID=UPI002494321A|nr:hypothetical protein [Marinifilum flexuosum]
MESNIRNTKIKILRVVIEKELDIERRFNFNEIKNLFYIREREFNTYQAELFEDDKLQFKFRSSIIDELNSYREKHNISKDSIGNCIEEYIEIFESKVKETYSYDLDELMKYIEPLHWYYLPIYSDLMITNRDVSPEGDLRDYYNHYHSLEDLYSVCKGKEENWRTLKGDINLNKELVFKVYTNRWGHEDHYKVERTYEGWNVININVGGSGSKSGSTFIDCFNQDYVNYPKDFKYIIERLWELADTNEMKVQELQDKLDDVAKLVSMVEKTVKEYTPNWY